MFKPCYESTTLICLSDVSTKYDGYNPVIFQAHASPEININNIKKITKEYFGIDLTLEQLESIISLEPKDFIKEYRKLIK